MTTEADKRKNTVAADAEKWRLAQAEEMLARLEVQHGRRPRTFDELHAWRVKSPSQDGKITPRREFVLQSPSFGVRPGYLSAADVLALARAERQRDDLAAPP